MKVTWRVISLGDGEFRLVDHNGMEVARVRRKRDVLACGYDYLTSDRRGYVDDIVFDGINEIPSCAGRLVRRTGKFFERIFFGG